MRQRQKQKLKLLFRPSAFGIAQHLLIVSVTMASPWTDENSLAKKWDYCAKDALLKTSAGAGIGLVFAFLLRSRRWPLTLGTGIGIGKKL